MLSWMRFEVVLLGTKVKKAERTTYIFKDSIENR